MRSSALNTSPRRRSDALLVTALRGAALVCGAIVVLIVALLVVEAWDALARIGPARFFTDPGWHPAAGGGDVAEGRYNITPMLAGTAAVTAGALLIAAPLGIGCAVFCRFHAPRWLAGPFRAAVELLAGVPSVVYGLWGLVVLAPLVGRLHPPGTSVATGALVLALMILPTVALTALSALRSVPAETLHGGAALGLSRRAVAWRVAVPAASGGIGTGLVLATGRALGETMAVLMVCGNVVQLPGSPFDPVRTLTANIALEMGYATAGHRSALFVSGLLLMALVAGLVMIAERIERRRTDAG